MILHAKVKPGSRVNKVETDDAGSWIIRLKAPPVEGRANEELIRFLSEQLRIPKSSVHILSGHNSRFKRLQIDGITEAQLTEKLLAE
jgi:hypothetical protein